MRAISIAHSFASTSPALIGVMLLVLALVALAAYAAVTLLGGPLGAPTEVLVGPFRWERAGATA
ncbi:MAG TPA: hypothetical protein VNW68_04795 [Candidatus Limnocylindria bacterium]|jgi:hypothetical protein|nr:hypothetical protein [Candidatus Limnocylindria bacterium]